MERKYFTLVIFFVCCLLLSCESDPWLDPDWRNLWAVAVDDLDMDGAVDIAVTSSDFDGNHYSSIILNDINFPGSFFLSDEYALLGGNREWPASIALGDLNDDGYSDIATENGSAIFILFQDSTQPGQFFVPLKISVGVNTESLAIGDLNEDGFNDIAIAGFSGPHLSILFQDSTNPGNFLPLLSIGLSSSSVAIADLDGDFINIPRSGCTRYLFYTYGFNGWE
jgi:hypothetical protein